MTTSCRCGGNHGPAPGDFAADEARVQHPILVRTLRTEDEAEDTGRLDPMDRVTCRTHGRWLHECVSSPVHTNAAVGYRWCRSCDHQALVAVDELSGEVTISCGLCGRMPPSRANRDLVMLCRRSLSLARACRGPDAAAA